MTARRYSPKVKSTGGQYTLPITLKTAEIAAKIPQRQELINQLQQAKGDQDLLRKLEAALTELRAHKGEAPDQDSINREQGKVNAMQERVNEEQGKVNAQQEKVNQEQQRVSAKYKGRVEAILESALQRHLAKEMK